MSNFKYMIMDELYTFIGKKRKKYYLWTSIAVTSTKRYFYYYHLSKNKDARALFTFNEDLPKVNKIGSRQLKRIFSYQF